MSFTIRLAEEDAEIVSVHQIMLEAFAEYDSYDIPSSAMNESGLYYKTLTFKMVLSRPSFVVLMRKLLALSALK